MAPWTLWTMAEGAGLNSIRQQLITDTSLGSALIAERVKHDSFALYHNYNIHIEEEEEEEEEGHKRKREDKAEDAVKVKKIKLKVTRW